MIGQLEILYEDPNLLVINKPAGLAVHGDSYSLDDTLVDWLESKYPDIVDVGDPFKNPFLGPDGKEVRRSGLVHRLDKDTSGVMVVAKTQGVHTHLKAQFMERSINKTYSALVYGNFQKDDGVIDKPIGSSPKDFRMGDASSAARGEMRDALTEYRVVDRFVSEDHGSDYSLVEASPLTGRKHQIRIHLKIISHPIVCDKLYAKGRSVPDPHTGMARLALHARKLELNLLSGDRQSFEAALPEDFNRALERLRSL